MDFSTVESYCQDKFKKDFASLPFEQQLEVNNQYLQEKYPQVARTIDSPTFESFQHLAALDTLNIQNPAVKDLLKLYIRGEEGPNWLRVPLPKRMGVVGDASPVDCSLPVVENPFHQHMGDSNLNELLTLTDISKAFNHVLLIGCSGCGKTAACTALASKRFAVYLECNDVRANPGAANGYRMNYSTWTQEKKELCDEKSVCFAFYAEIAARLVVLFRLLQSGNLTPLDWLLYVMSEEGATRVRAVYNAIKRGRYHVTEAVLESLLKEVNKLVAETPTPESVVLVVDELQQLGKNTVPAYDPSKTISVMRAVVNAACCLAMSAVWSGTRMTVSQAISETSAFAKDLPHQKKLMIVGIFAYLEKVTVESLLDQLLDLSLVTPSVKSQLCYGLQGRARTCAGFVTHLMGSKLARDNRALDDEILGVFEDFMESKILDRVQKDIDTLHEREYMKTTDIGLLWCHTMLPVIHVEQDDSNRLNCIAFTKSVSVIARRGYATQHSATRVTSSTEDAPIQIEQTESQVASYKYQYQFQFGEPSLQEAMLRIVRQKPEVADSGVFSLLSTTLNPTGMGACLDYAVALSLLYKHQTFLRGICPGTAFDEYKDYMLSVSRIVSTSSAEDELEWFEKVLADPEDCTFKLLPGVPVKNIAILPSTLSGADIICVALKNGSSDQPYISRGSKRKLDESGPPGMVFLHTCCANYDGGATAKKHESQLVKSGPQMQSKRKCFAAERYREVAMEYADQHDVIPILFEMPQRDLILSADEKNYLLVSDRQNWEHIFSDEVKELLKTRGKCSQEI